MEETIEEAAAKHFNKEVFVEGVTIQYALQEAFITGAKYQAEKMYSEEDMTEYAIYIVFNNLITPKQWFEQFKKK